MLQEKKELLIVDENLTSLEEIDKTLYNHGYKLTKANSVDEAKRLCQATSFDLVLLEVNLLNSSGLAFLKWIKENIKTPVILMAETTEKVKALNLPSLGVKGFLEKPIIIEDIFQILRDDFLDSENQKESVDHEYCRLSIDDFVLGSKLKFDMYFRIRDTKYVKISHRGEDIGIARAESYKKKNMRYLYVTKQDYIKFVEGGLGLLNNHYESKKIIERRKIEFIKNLTESTLQGLFKNEVNQEDFVYAGTLVMNSLSLLADDSATLDILVALSKQTDFLYAHSVGVSLCSVLIARMMKIVSAPVLFKLAVGAFLHDISKKSIPLEILTKKTSEHSASDTELFRRHATEGATLLTGLEFIPPEVVLIVHQHHENCLSTGFPSQLSRETIHPSARIVSLANEFCNLTIKNPDSEGMGAVEAISRIETGIAEHSPERFDPECRAALKKIFRVESTPEHLDLRLKS